MTRLRLTGIGRIIRAISSPCIACARKSSSAGTSAQCVRRRADIGVLTRRTRAVRAPGLDHGTYSARVALRADLAADQGGLVATQARLLGSSQVVK